MRGFVKPVKRLDLLNALGVHPLRAPVTQAAALSRSALAGARLGLGQILLHRTARHELDHHKSQQQHAKQRGDHQQQAFKDIAKHLAINPSRKMREPPCTSAEHRGTGFAGPLVLPP